MNISPKVSIIILNWNGWKDTLDCLESLGKITYPNYNLLVVDNASGGRDVSIIKGKFPLVSIIRNKNNLGFARGNNIAISQILKEAKSEYVLLLNNDTVVEKDFLNKLIKIAQEEKKVAICGPKIYYSTYQGKKNIIQSAGCMVNLYLGRFPSVEKLDKPNNQPFNNPLSVDFVSGACFLIKAEVIRKIGLLDNRYFLLFEDTDWCLRAKKAGYLVFYVPSSVIWHKVSQSFKKEHVSQVYYYTRNLFWFEFKHANHFQFLCFFVYYFLFVFPKYFFGYILVKKDRQLLVNYLYGIREGILNRSKKNHIEKSYGQAS